MLSVLLIGAAFGFSAAVQPGPFQAYLVSSTMVRGWRHTLPTVFAPVLSDIPVVALVLTVLARVGNAWLDVLRMAGGVFLLYLASKAWRAYREYGQDGQGQAASLSYSEGVGSAPARSVLEAATVNLLNPNPYIAWSTVLGPLVLRSWTDAPTHAAAFVAAFYGTMVGSTIVLVLLLAGARSLGSAVGRAFVAFSALALAAFGAWQIGVGALSVL